MVDRFKEWIKWKIYEWFKQQNWWWENHLPDATTIRFDNAGAIQKDERYWTQIAVILENKPFMQEMAEMEGRYRKTIDKLMMNDDVDWKTAHDVRLELKGFKRALLVIVDAHNETIKHRETNGLKD